MLGSRLAVALLVAAFGVLACGLSSGATGADPSHAAQVAPGASSTRTGTTTTTDATADPRVTSGLAATARPIGTSRSAVVTPRAASDLLPGSVHRSSIHLRATYNASVTLSYRTRLLALDSRMTIVNTSSRSIDRVRLNTVAARLGGLRLRSVAVDGEPVGASVDDQTITVPFGGILPVGGTVHLRMRTRSTLRTSLSGSSWMYTRANGIIDAYRWLPWISRSLRFDRPNHGDPFMTPVSPEVRVTITTDRPMVIATSGSKVSSSGLTRTYVAWNVRDFTIIASPYYRTKAVTVGNKVVRVYYRSGAAASSMLSAARHALSRYASLLATSYPYTTFKVVQSAGGYGMESPGLIWIPRGISTSNLTYLVYHETAHQWFYGLVGNNQAREPFTDEAAADFIARYALSLRRGSRCSKDRLDLSIYRYSSTCYYEVIYIQGGNFLDGLRRDMGSTAFWKGLRAYVAASRWRLVSTKSLLDTLDAATPLNLVPRFERRFPRLY